MIKKIPVDQVCLGMHIHAFCGSWVDHPFWRPKFTLTTVDEVQRIKTSGTSEVWIDTNKGLDAPAPEAQAAAAEPAQAAVPAAPPRATKPVASEPRMSREQSLAAAEALCRKAKPQVAAMFAEARLGKAVNGDTCAGLVEEISQSVQRHPDALINVARLKRRDEYTYMHSVAVCALMVALARRLGLEEKQVRDAGLAGMLHDLGKAMMPLEVLNKPGKLTDAEYALMKDHPQRGHALLVEGREPNESVLDVCLHHHEKMDGSGYPHGLAGDQISLFAKMGAICDVYDAVTSQRIYKKAWDPADALRHMAQWKGHFDPKVFQAFVATVGIYPVGSLVRLASGRIAVVIAQDAKSLLAPVVKAFFSKKSEMRIEPMVIDLAATAGKDKIVACESPADWAFVDVNALWSGHETRP